MFLFVILFLSLWAVAASIVVDRTDQCGSDMLPCRNHMWCLGYNGIVALLSGCSLVRYCCHEFISSLLSLSYWKFSEQRQSVQLLSKLVFEHVNFLLCR